MSESTLSFVHDSFLAMQANEFAQLEAVWEQEYADPENWDMLDLLFDKPTLPEHKQLRVAQRACRDAFRAIKGEVAKRAADEAAEREARRHDQKQNQEVS